MRRARIVITLACRGLPYWVFARTSDETYWYCRRLVSHIQRSNPLIFCIYLRPHCRINSPHNKTSNTIVKLLFFKKKRKPKYQQQRRRIIRSTREREKRLLSSRTARKIVYRFRTRTSLSPLSLPFARVIPPIHFDPDYFCRSRFLIVGRLKVTHARIAYRYSSSSSSKRENLFRAESRTRFEAESFAS